MGQPNANRLQYEHIQPLTSSLNDDRQTIANTGCLEIGDILEFWDRDGNGCLETLIGTRTLTGICPNEAITLDSTIDLTVVSGTAVIRNRSIDDIGQALGRYCAKIYQSDDYRLVWAPAILASETDTPSGGQSRHEVEDSTCFEAGDLWQIISDEGLAGSGTVVSTDDAQDLVVIDDSIDAFGTLTNPKLINTSVTLKTHLLRIKDAIANSGKPSYAFGRGSTVTEDTWLYSGNSVPSNKTGIPFGLSDGVLTYAWVGNELLVAYDVEIYWHEGDETNLTLLATLSVGAGSRTATFDIGDFGLVLVPQDKQIACFVTNVSSTNPRNVSVHLTIAGSS